MQPKSANVTGLTSDRDQNHLANEQTATTKLIDHQFGFVGQHQQQCKFRLNSAQLNQHDNNVVCQVQDNEQVRPPVASSYYSFCQFCGPNQECNCQNQLSMHQYQGPRVPNQISQVQQRFGCHSHQAESSHNQYQVQQQQAISTNPASVVQTPPQLIYAHYDADDEYQYVNEINWTTNSQLQFQDNSFKDPDQGRHLKLIDASQYHQYEIGVPDQQQHHQQQQQTYQFGQIDFHPAFNKPADQSNGTSSDFNNNNGQIVHQPSISGANINGSSFLDDNQLTVGKYQQYARQVTGYNSPHRDSAPYNNRHLTSYIQDNDNLSMTLTDDDQYGRTTTVAERAASVPSIPNGDQGSVRQHILKYSASSPSSRKTSLANGKFLNQTTTFQASTSFNFCQPSASGSTGSYASSTTTVSTNLSSCSSLNDINYNDLYNFQANNEHASLTASIGSISETQRGLGNKLRNIKQNRRGRPRKKGQRLESKYCFFYLTVTWLVSILLINIFLSNN